MRQRVSSGSPFESTVGFSRGIRAGSLVSIAGTAPVSPDGTPASAEEQTRLCLTIIRDALAGLGAEMSEVIRTRIYLVDTADWEAVAKVHGEFFRDIKPASTMVAVKALLDPAWRVEIEADAWVE